MKKDSYFNNNSILELLFDTVQKTKISEQSYSVIWFCLQEQILNNRFDLIYDYWSKAHQYLWLNISEIFEKYKDDFKTILNAEEIKDRNKQRQRFLEFHYALGGFLMFQANELKKKNSNNYIEIYNLIHKLSKHTSSQPPQFYLIPDDINKLLNGYDSFNSNFTYDFIIQQRYPFHNLYHDIHHGGIICNWARKYFAFLFLNLYSIEEYFIYTKPFDLKPINNNDKLHKINSQINSFETLKKDVEELLLEKKTLIELGLSINQYIGFKRDKNIDPLKCLDDYISESKIRREELIKNQKVNPVKLDDFRSNTKKLISNAINKFSSLWKEQNDINKEEYYFSRSMLLDKMAFSDEQDMGYTNHDQVLAQYIAQQYSHFCINIFRQLTTISYSLEKKDIKEGLDKLKIREDEHVIIYFGSNFESYELDNNNIKIINDFYGELSETFYILEDEDLPEVKSTKIKDKENILIKGTEYIYADIIDLHKEENKDLKDKLSKQYPDEDLDRKVQAYVLFKVGLKIKPNIKCVCIKCYQQYFEKGMPNKLEDVGPFN